MIYNIGIIITGLFVLIIPLYSNVIKKGRAKKNRITKAGVVFLIFALINASLIFIKGCVDNNELELANHNYFSLRDSLKKSEKNILESWRRSEENIIKSGKQTGRSIVDTLHKSLKNEVNFLEKSKAPIININDAGFLLQENQYYYYFKIENIGKRVALIKSGKNHIFLLDSKNHKIQHRSYSLPIKGALIDSGKSMTYKNEENNDVPNISKELKIYYLVTIKFIDKLLNKNLTYEIFMKYDPELNFDNFHFSLCLNHEQKMLNEYIKNNKILK